MPIIGNSDELADLSEPFIDEAGKLILQNLGYEVPQLASDIPIVRTAFTVGKMFNLANDYLRMRKLVSFINGLTGDAASFERFQQLPPNDQEVIRSIIISELDAQTDIRQAEATGYVVDAFIKSEIDRLHFVGLIHEIKNINPLIFYFNVDSIRLNAEDGAPITAEGPVSYLPTSFGAEKAIDIGQWDARGKTKYFLTELGIIFFEKVYVPMSEKYTL